VVIGLLGALLVVWIDQHVKVPPQWRYSPSTASTVLSAVASAVVREPDYLLGTITQTPMQQLPPLPSRRGFGQDKRDTLTQYCVDCDVRFLKRRLPQGPLRDLPPRRAWAVPPVLQRQGLL
jgi:hypothetical protein